MRSDELETGYGPTPTHRIKSARSSGFKTAHPGITLLDSSIHPLLHLQPPAVEQSEGVIIQAGVNYLYGDYIIHLVFDLKVGEEICISHHCATLGENNRMWSFHSISFFSPTLSFEWISLSLPLSLALSICPFLSDPSLSLCLSCRLTPLFFSTAIYYTLLTFPLHAAHHRQSTMHAPAPTR